jgi:hypothetical protein
MNSDLEVHDDVAKIIGKDMVQLLWEKGFVVVEKDRVVKLSGAKVLSTEAATDPFAVNRGKRTIMEQLMARASNEIEFDYIPDTDTGQLKIIGSFRYVKLGTSLFGTSN